jgi:hypothetical protein
MEARAKLNLVHLCAAQLFLLLKQGIEGVGVGAELTKVLSGSAPSQFVLTTAFLATDYAESLQVPHYGGIGFSHLLRINRKREQHLL